MFVTRMLRTFAWSMMSTNNNSLPWRNLCVCIFNKLQHGFMVNHCILRRQICFTSLKDCMIHWITFSIFLMVTILVKSWFLSSESNLTITVLADLEIIHTTLNMIHSHLIFTIHISPKSATDKHMILVLPNFFVEEMDIITTLLHGVS